MNGPMFMKNILNFDIQFNGLISGLPFICSYFSSVLFCYVADVIVRHKILNLTNVRKLMTASSQIIPGLLVVLVGYLGKEITTVIIIWSIAVTMVTAAYAGAMAAIVDISPNFAGPVLAFAQTIHMSASFLAPLVNGNFIQDPTNLGQWQFCFLVASIVAIVTYLMFQVYGTAEIQEWNYHNPPNNDDEANAAEREILNNQNESNKKYQQVQEIRKNNNGSVVGNHSNDEDFDDI
jgi:MFS family permease